MPYPGLAERLADIRTRIGEHQKAGGWTHPVTIVAVTKTHPAEAVRAVVAAGLTAVGENRVQEALAKQAELTELPVEWHLIGSLQRNKAKLAVNRFALIHSVDSAALAQELNRRAAPGTRQPILVQVNCSDEPQKGGAEPGELPGLVEAIGPLEHLELRGLMTMAALTDDQTEQRTAFQRLRELRDREEARGHHLPELSMGMSGDYAVAIEEGATIVRLGTLLFGERGI
jgi:PLP dependent protein